MSQGIRFSFLALAVKCEQVDPFHKAGVAVAGGTRSASSILAVMQPDSSMAETIIASSFFMVSSYAVNT